MASYAERLGREFGYEEPLPFSYFRPEYAARYRTKALAGMQPIMGRDQLGAGVLTGVRGADIRDFGQRAGARSAAAQTLGHRLEVGRLLEERKDELKRYLEADAAREEMEKSVHRRNMAKFNLGKESLGLLDVSGRIFAEELEGGNMPWQEGAYADIFQDMVLG